MSDLQEQVQEAIDRAVSSGVERGVQVAAYLGGESLVQAVAGISDPETERTVTPETPFYNFSIVKGAASTLAHMLVERGLFGYDTPVVDLWPEFGAHGKQAVAVRHVLDHSAGVPGIPQETTPEDLCDWDHMCAAIADAELWWEPGTKVGYHAYTFGYMVGEIARRATGTRISELLLEEVAAPLGVSNEIYFGMPQSEHHRLARLEDSEGSAEMVAMLSGMPPDMPMMRATPMALYPTAEFGNRADILSADIPAGGKTSARAIARMYAALLDQFDGVRLIPPARLAEATSISTSGVDEVFGMPTSWGLGYAIGLPGSTAQDTPTAFGLGGLGGSFAYGDTATGLAFALTKNRLTPDFGLAIEIIGLVTDAISKI